MVLHFITLDRATAEASAWEWLIYRVMKQGWIGVDLFFVLSGFLITGILLDNKRAPNYFKSFYIRRILRIFPLYYAYLLLLFLVIYPLAHGRSGPAEQEKIDLVRDNFEWFLFYASNIKQALMGDSFHANTSHLWSLAIEEQFYVFWPLLVWLVPTRRVPLLCAAMVIGSLIVRIVMVEHEASYDAIRSLTFGRLDGLAVGSFLAYYVRHHKSPQLPEAALIVSGMAIVLGLALIAGRDGAIALIVTVGYSILAMYFGLIVLRAFDSQTSDPPSPVGSFLGFFGKYCYALYMLHPLVFAFFSKVTGSLGAPAAIWGSQLPWQLFSFVACTAMSAAAAMLSWRLLEQPVLRLKRHFPY